MIVNTTLDHLSKLENNYIVNCKKLQVIDLSIHWEIIIQIVCQKVNTLNIISSRGASHIYRELNLDNLLELRIATPDQDSI